MRGEEDEALPCFQQCLSISEGQDKAAALNMLGCCCAMKVEHGIYECLFNSVLNVTLTLWSTVLLTNNDTNKMV